MATKILDDVKLALNIAPGYTAFDDQLLLYINSSFATLHQLGVGPDEGFQIADNTAVWDELYTEYYLNTIRSFMVIDVGVLFDPPTNPSVLNAKLKIRDELVWRLQIAAQPNYNSEDPDDE